GGKDGHRVSHVFLSPPGDHYEAVANGVDRWRAGARCTQRFPRGGEQELQHEEYAGLFAGRQGQVKRNVLGMVDACAEALPKRGVERPRSPCLYVEPRAFRSDGWQSRCFERCSLDQDVWVGGDRNVTHLCHKTRGTETRTYLEILGGCVIGVEMRTFSRPGQPRKRRSPGCPLLIPRQLSVLAVWVGSRRPSL